ncbi:MAG TPA: hypothetical protein PKM88_12110 [bacterium]|nr:hypothetical protein [bacterium]
MIRDDARFRPLPGLQETAARYRESYIRWHSARFLTGDRQAMLSPLAEKSYVADNLFLDFCWLQVAAQLAATAPGRGTVLLTARPAFAAALARLPGIAAVAHFSVGMPAVDRLCRGGRTRWQLLRESARAATTARAARRVSTEPVSLLRTWLDDRCFRDGRFRDVYLGELRRRTAYRPVYWFYCLEPPRLRNYIAQLDREGIDYCLDADFGIRGVARDAMRRCRAVPPPGRVEFAGVDLSDVAAEQRQLGWVDDHAAFPDSVARAVAGMAACGYPVREVWYPFENQPWEKAMNAAFARHLPQVLRCGYQHALLPAMYLNHFDVITQATAPYYPQRIYASGRHSECLLREWYGERVLPAPAYRYRHLHQHRPVAEAYAKRPHRIIVAAGINPLRAQVLVRTVVEAFRETEYEVVFKMHPTDGQTAAHWREQLPGRMSFADECRPLRELLETGRYFIYADTAAVVEALGSGLPAVMLEPETTICYDMLPDAVRKRAGGPAGMRDSVAEWNKELSGASAYAAFLLRAGAALTELLNLPADEEGK